MKIFQLCEMLQKCKSKLQIKNVKGEEERYTYLNAEFQRQQGEIRKPSSVISTKKQRKTIEWERLEIASGKLEIPGEYFMQKWAK